MELDEAQEAYYQMFGDNFPNMEVKTKNEAEQIAAIRKCLESGKDAQEVFGITYEDGIEY